MPNVPAALIPRSHAEQQADQMRRWYDSENPFLRAGHPEDIEQLHPALRPYVQITPELGHSLRHPLHYQVMGVNWRMANDIYAEKVREVGKARADGNWYRFLKLHERPYRLTTLADLWDSGSIKVEDLRELLGDMWSDAEYPSQHGKRLLLRLFKAAGFITDVEPETTEEWAATGADPYPKALADVLPEEVTVYRGQPIGEKPGLSWTTDIEMGAWFARRYRDDATAMLLRGTVKREKVLAYLEGRGEHEVVVDPRYVRDITMIALPEPTGRSPFQPGFPKITKVTGADPASVSIG